MLSLLRAYSGFTDHTPGLQVSQYLVGHLVRPDQSSLSLPRLKSRTPPPNYPYTSPLEMRLKLNCFQRSEQPSKIHSDIHAQEVLFALKFLMAQNINDVTAYNGYLEKEK